MLYKSERRLLHAAPVFHVSNQSGGILGGCLTYLWTRCFWSIYLVHGSQESKSYIHLPLKYDIRCEQFPLLIVIVIVSMSSVWPLRCTYFSPCSWLVLSRVNYLVRTRIWIWLEQKYLFNPIPSHKIKTKNDVSTLNTKSRMADIAIN